MKLLGFVVIFIGCAVSHSYARSYQQINSGDVSLSYTSDNYTYNNFYLHVMERNYIVVKVKACSDAHIALIDSSKNTDYPRMIEIVIGGWTNTLSVIRFGAQGDEWLTSLYTYDILHCGEFRTFWVHWSSHIAVGRGPTYFEQEFLNTARADDHYFDINYVAFSTGFGHTGVWEVTQGIAYHMMVHTPDVTPPEYQYHTRSVEKAYGFFHFRAIACHDLHIAMGPNNHDWQYLVNLCSYGNTRNCIWHEFTGHCENKTNVCDCSSYRPYWISWKDNVIRVGQGNTIHNSQLVEYTPSFWHDVGFLSFASGWGSDAYWVFNEDLENSFDMKGSRFQTEFENWIGTSKHHFVPFHVQACSDAWICLSGAGANCGENSYLIYIAKNNAKTGISQGFDDVIVEIDTVDILDCNMSLPFWVSWYNGKVEFGAGLDYSFGKVFEHETGNSFFAQAVGFGTRGDATLWNVKKNHGDFVFAVTGPNLNSLTQNLWMTVRQEFVMYFKLKGESNAIVYLSEIPFYPDKYGYEVHIASGGSLCFICQRIDGSCVPTASEDISGVLSPEEFRTFWVSWKDGRIHFGAGYKYQQRVIIESVEYIPHVINGVGFGSELSTLAWEIEAEQGDYFSMRIDGHPSNDNKWGYKWVHTYRRENGYWLYFQVSGVGACVVLSLNYGDATGAYVIHLGEDENTKVTMYNWDGDVVAQSTQPNLMHQDELQTFWVSWEDGNLMLGKSRYKGHDIIVSYTDTDFKDVRALAVAGLDSYVANFRFGTRQGVEEFSFKTNQYEDFQQIWMSLQRRTSMVFSVQACKEVHMWFGGVMYSENWYDSYLVVLQDSTGYSYISAPFINDQGWSRKIAVQIETPDILSCDEERFFWAAWNKNELLIGNGTEINRNYVLMSFHDFDPVPIRAFSVHTYTAEGIFRFPMSSNAFQDRSEAEEDTSNGLSAGEIVGAVFGFIILITLFVGAIYIILRPPDALKPYLSPPPAAGSSLEGGVRSREVAEHQLREQGSGSHSFDNPLSESKGNVEGTY